MRCPLSVVLIGALIALPSATQAGSTTAGEPAFTFATEVRPPEVETTLYFHPINVQGMPINTQRPDLDRPWDDGLGASAVTVSCLDGELGSLPQGATKMEFHTYRGYGTPSYVDYGNASLDGAPRVHPVRGLGYDVLLADDQSMLHWFLAEAAPPQAGREAAPLVNVQVRATVYAAESLDLKDDSGPVLMQGATAPVTAFAGQVVGEGANQVTATQAAGRWVYDFAVPLDHEADRIPRATGYTVRIEALLENPSCQGDGTLMPGTVDPFADADHEPRIVLRHADPLRIDYLHPQFVGNELWMHTRVLSPWGNYDVLTGEARLEVFGVADVTPRLNDTIQRSFEHFHLLDPAQQNWVIDPDGLPDGRYTAVYTVPNLQRTAVAEARVAFTVQDGQLIEGDLRESPGPAPLLVLGALAIGGMLRRRHA